MGSILKCNSGLSFRLWRLIYRNVLGPKRFCGIELLPSASDVVTQKMARRSLLRKAFRITWYVRIRDILSDLKLGDIIEVAGVRRLNMMERLIFFLAIYSADKRFLLTTNYLNYLYLIKIITTESMCLPLS